MTGGGGGGSLAGLWYFLLILFVAIVTRSTAGKDPDDNGEFAVPDPPLVEQYGGNISNTFHIINCRQSNPC